MFLFNTGEVLRGYKLNNPFVETEKPEFIFQSHFAN